MSGLEESFADVWDLSKNCRFSDCTHTREAGCALLDSIGRTTSNNAIQPAARDFVPGGLFAPCPGLNKE